MSSFADMLKSDMYDTILWKEFADKDGNTISANFTDVGTIPTCREISTRFDIDETSPFIIESPQNLTKTLDKEQVNKCDNFYYIDYIANTITFSENLIGYRYCIKYFGTKFMGISANKVFTNIDNIGKPIEFLDEVVDSTKDMREVTSKVEELPNMINTIKIEQDNLTNQLTNVEEATTIANQVKKEVDTSRNKAETTNNNLTKTNNTATKTNTTLEGNISTGNILSDDLKTSITNGTTLNTNLGKTTTQANTAKTKLDTIVPRAEKLATNISSSNNRKFDIQASDLIKNDETGLYEYTLNHNLDNLKLQIELRNATTNRKLLDLGHIIDKDNYLVVNDEQIDITMICNIGYWGGTV